MVNGSLLVCCHCSIRHAKDAKVTIATALAMGVKVKMVTGDALAIAQETAKKLDMGANILDASGLGGSKKQESTEVAESIEKADGFAQVFPEHKFHIVDVLQERGRGWQGARRQVQRQIPFQNIARYLHLQPVVRSSFTVPESKCHRDHKW